MSQELLTDVLRSVSRAFYLSMAILPRDCRAPIATGYLLARAADTIADTEHLPPQERMRALCVYRDQVLSDRPEPERLRELAALAGAGDSSEERLLRRLPDCCALLPALAEDDRAAVRRIVSTLIAGMVEDLEHFPPGQLSALPDEAALDRHTFMAAGCVGEFWTDVLLRHVPALRGADRARLVELGIRFGKALQLTNVLRDVPADLALGRCYLPVDPAAVRGPEGEAAFRRFLSLAVDHYRAANHYIDAIPGRLWRLRLSVLWPVLIGLATLARLADSPWLSERRVKVPRSWVYQTILRSLPIAGLRPLVRRWVGSWIAEVERALARRGA